MSVYLGLDYGSVTCGIAISTSGILSSPLLTIRFEKDSAKACVEKLLPIISENRVTDIVIGHPINMDDTLGERSRKTEKLKTLLGEATSCNIYLQDERLTTLETKEIFRMTSNYKKKKKDKDMVSAMLILQRFLDKKGMNG